MKTWMKWAIGAFVALIVIGAISGGNSPDDKSSTTSASSSTKSGKSSSSGDKKSDGCGATATDDCTPHLAAGKRVRVDALYYSITSAKTVKTLGDTTYGLGQKADGVFVVLKLKVHSDRDQSATLSDSTFKLEVGGNSYDTDTDGTVAAIGAGEQPFFLKDIGPDVTTTGTVVFDVPRSVLAKHPEIRFNELGFGSTHGYLALPDLT